MPVGLIRDESAKLRGLRGNVGPWVAWVRGLCGSIFYVGCVGYVGQDVFYVGHNFYVGCVGLYFCVGPKIFCVGLCVGQLLDAII